MLVAHCNLTMFLKAKVRIMEILVDNYTTLIIMLHLCRRKKDLLVK